MANPTGNIFLQANQGYTWTDGDVYQIPQTDTVEGAALSASFSGLGVANQPHQLLLNKIQNLYNAQLRDESNIAFLQSILTLTSHAGSGGWMQLPMNDVNLGHIDLILQWGTLSLIGQPNSVLLDNILSITFPEPFPNAIWLMWPYWQSNNTTGLLVYQGGSFLVLEVVIPMGLSTVQIASDVNEVILAHEPQTAQTATDGTGITGIGWFALGY